MCVSVSTKYLKPETFAMEFSENATLTKSIFESTCCGFSKMECATK
jgi:hypothetical protein